MVKKIDISDLLVEDARLPYNWRSATVRKDELTLLFPHSGYSIDGRKSELRENGKEWALYVKINQNTLTLAIEKEVLKIPHGVEKIVFGTVEYL